MCGIFAWAGKTPKKFNRSSFNILGLYNESRGKTSCGESIDGDIRVGLKSTRLFTDYIVKGEPLPNPVRVPVVIGHTRQASNGGASIENAHPFGFGEKAHGYSFIGVHNGTLYNKTELAKKYEVNANSVTETNHSVTTRVKIDSEILLECIYQSESFKVLNDYQGGAALVFTNLNEPNVIYCYHGASKYYNTSVSELEERPLYYYKESKNSLYISSLENSLLVLSGGVDDNIKEFDTNIVYKITDGDIDKAVKFKVDRSNQVQKETYSSSWSKPKNKSNYGINKRNEYKKKNTPVNKTNNLFDITDKPKLDADQNIYKENPRLTSANMGKRPIFYKLRYFRNGHLVDGIYTFISDYGYYYLGHTELEADKNAEDIKGKIFDYANGDFVTSTGSYRKNHKVAFLKNAEIKFYYFYKGVILKTRLDFTIATMNHNTEKEFTWKELSFMSKHPVCNIEANKHYTAQGVHWEGTEYTGWYGGLGAYRAYRFLDGNLIDSNDIPLPSGVQLKPKEPVVIELPLPKIDLETVFEDCECGDHSCISCADNFNYLKEVEETTAENGLVLDTIDEIFEDALTKLPEGKELLKKYLPNKKAEKAIKIIDTLIDSTLEIN
tara:strand:- start:885 stop:2711 length:1827 start_codon:yes stop_codon:yes gene_type:complete